MTNEIKLKKDELISEKDLIKSVETYFTSLTEALNDNQKKEFFMLCKLYNLNPLKREIYAVKYREKFNVITNYYEYLKRADSTGLLEYHDVTIEDKENPATKRMGPYKAVFIAKRKDWTREYKTTIMFNEYSTGQSTWLSKPYFMIEKCAIANGLRRLFPNELGNMPYINEELWFYNKDNEAVINEHVNKDKVLEIDNRDLADVLKKVGK